MLFGSNAFRAFLFSSTNVGPSGCAGLIVRLPKGFFAGMMAVCKPIWAAQGLPCPYGHASGLTGSTLTWPNNVDSLTYVAAAYSMAPFFIFATPIAIMILSRGTRELAAFMLAMCLQIANHSLKVMYGMPRPVGSCLTSCGMPSGHTALSIGVFTWVMLEVWCGAGAVCLPGTAVWPMSEVCNSLSLSILLLPVGLSRIYLVDHSLNQVLAGGLVGLAVGCVWFHMLRSKLFWWACRWLTTTIPVFKMNYNHPDRFKSEVGGPWQQCRQGYGSQNNTFESGPDNPRAE